MRTKKVYPLIYEKSNRTSAIGRKKIVFE